MNLNIRSLPPQHPLSSPNDLIMAEDQPDLVFFYSEPLVDQIINKQNKEQLVSSGSASLSTEIEYRRLVDILKRTARYFKIAKEAINGESLKEMIAKKPTMIHISCHGDYDKDQNEFYLLFEGVGDGISDRFNETRLHNLLGDKKDHGIKLAFVSACHSEKIGNIFSSCGIPIVIGVNQYTEIADEICLIFSRHLYMHLLQGATI